MRVFAIALIVSICSIMFGATGLSDKKPSNQIVLKSKLMPYQIVFKSKIMGDVTFGHIKHAKRENRKCEICHPKLFPQSWGPINFKRGMHKPAVAEKRACAACHVADGKAFAIKGNCKTCHVKK